MLSARSREGTPVAIAAGLQHTASFSIRLHVFEVLLYSSRDFYFSIDSWFPRLNCLPDGQDSHSESTGHLKNVLIFHCFWEALGTFFCPKSQTAERSTTGSFRHWNSFRRPELFRHGTVTDYLVRKKMLVRRKTCLCQMKSIKQMLLSCSLSLARKYCHSSADSCDLCWNSSGKECFLFTYRGWIVQAIRKN